MDPDPGCFSSVGSGPFFSIKLDPGIIRQYPQTCLSCFIYFQEHKYFKTRFLFLILTCWIKKLYIFKLDLKVTLSIGLQLVASYSRLTRYLRSLALKYSTNTSFEALFRLDLFIQSKSGLRLAVFGCKP